ncbi:Poly(rC)-binding protein 3 [Coemansia sp. Benny D115]|nr:Poly(rC)-binding protein 3 [Coemansia sp. Benny D115]
MLDISKPHQKPATKASGDSSTNGHAASKENTRIPAEPKPTSDFELDIASDHESQYTLAPPGRNCGAVAQDNDMQIDIACTGDEPKEKHDEKIKDKDRADDKDKEQLALRIVFPCEDGGMLIGKNGRHITRLKETTDASWFITSTFGSTSTEDRIVVIRGTLATISHAVLKLAEHIAKEKASNDPLTFCILFPVQAIGFILGAGGRRIAKIREMEGVTNLHISKDALPFTQERVVEARGTPQGLKTISYELLHSMQSELPRIQADSILYQPTRNGLRLFLAQDHQNSAGSRISGNSTKRYPVISQSFESQFKTFRTSKPSPSAFQL